MSNFKTLRLNDEELTSPSSDEKMDTGSESFRSQDTPNSVLSSEFDGDHIEPVLRLQNPDIRLSGAELNDSLVKKMSYLSIDSPKVPPKNLGISPPKYNSILTLTTNHPLMSPDENYPDLIPKKIHKIEDEKDLSLSSIEDEKAGENNGFYSPVRNTSKNNLYFTDAFVTAESQDLDVMLTPDVTRIDKLERRKIVPKLKETPEKGDTLKFMKENLKQSTPNTRPIDISVNEQFTGVAEWCESPSQLRTMPNFELPIEMSSSLGIHNDLDSPDLISTSTQEDRSAYQALLDPYTGSVALRHTPAQHKSPGTQRRKILLPPEVEEDSCSLDSVSICSMESEEEPPEPEPEVIVTPHPVPLPRHDLRDNSISKSSNTVSECSDPIPEYSAAEELSNEREWISVPRGTGHATCDMKVIEPYKRVISHGGYDSRGAALIVFSACHLPDCARPDYTYVMDNLFLYVIWTLERLVTDEYVLVYLHGSAGRRKLPTFHWLHECYKLIDRRLRKSLKHLYLVHPTFWLKSFVILTKPFVSSKFFRKLSYVTSLADLMQKVPVEPNAIPEVVKQFDATRR